MKAHKGAASAKPQPSKFLGGPVGDRPTAFKKELLGDGLRQQATGEWLPRI